MLELGIRSSLQFLIGFEDDVGEIGCIGTAIALRSKMEWGLRVLREAIQEQFEEGVYILSCNWGSGYSRTIFSIRVADVDGLVEYVGRVGWAELADAEVYLEVLFDARVDMMSWNELKPRVRPYIEPDLLRVA